MCLCVYMCVCVRAHYVPLRYTWIPITYLWRGGRMLLGFGYFGRVAGQNEKGEVLKRERDPERRVGCLLDR